MLREERLKQILDKLQQDQRLSTTQLMADFEVSEGTIRRDLKELQTRGLLQKVHGGAVPRPAAPRIYQNRLEYASEPKAELAKKALPLLENGQLILIDGGTTNWHLANAFPPQLEATVFTNSIPIVQTLLAHPGLEIHLMGGKVFQASQVSLGSEVMQALGDIRPDICFMGVRSLQAEIGFTTLEREEAKIKRKMVEVSQRVVVMATNDKLDTVDHYRICGCEEVDLLIVEQDAPEDKLSAFRERGMEIQ